MANKKRSLVPQLGDRILELRKDRKMSQSELGEYAGVGYAQIGRYESNNAQPPAVVLKKIADAFGVSLDYLLYGSPSDKAKSRLNDRELIDYFCSIEQLDKEDQKVIKKLIEAFIMKSTLEKILTKPKK